MSFVTKIGLIGDVHCEDSFLSLAINTLRSEQSEAFVCTGDVPTGRGDINRCCNLLRTNEVVTVRGNHDRWLLNFDDVQLPHATSPSIVTQSSWRFLESLPTTIDLRTPDGLALVCHGLMQHDMLSILPEQANWELEEHPILQSIMESARYRWIINGHSHHRMVRRFRSITIVNAGTLRRDHNPCFASVDFERSEVRYWDIVDQETAILSAALELP